MAERKPLFVSSEGFSEEMATSDSMTLGGLTMGGNIDMNSAGKIVNANAATTDGDVLVFGQSGANLAGLDIDTSDLTMNGQKITGLGTGTADADAVTLLQLNNAVINGGHVREMLLYEGQCSDAEGVLAAVALTLQVNPSNDDRVVLTDGTTTRTYYYGTGTGDVSVTIGADAWESMQNLATAIEGDGSAIWGAFATQDLESIDATGVVVIYEDDNDGSASEIYGTNWGAGECQIVDFGGEVEYTKKTLSDIPSSDPASTNFGMNRTQASLLAGEIHPIEVNDILKYWDSDGEVWTTMTGASSIPDATSASGGGVKGKVTFDSDKGLSVTSGVAEVVLEASKGLQFESGGGIGIDIVSTDRLSVGASGLDVVGLPSLFEINGVAVGATVTAANLDTLTDTSNADALHDHTNASVTVTHASTTGQTTDDHHNQVHAIDGADHSLSGATTGHVLTATSATTFAFQAPAEASAAQRVENTMTTATDTTANGDPVYVNGNDTIGKGRADTDAKARIIGVIRTGAGAAGSTPEVVSLGAAAGILTTATANTPYYLGATGGITTSVPGAGNRVIQVGKAMNADDLWVQIIDFGKKAA